MDNFKRIDRGILYPPFVALVEELVENCNNQNKIYIATCGLRSYEEQAKIYAKGRTTGKLGHIVTKAGPGQSPHNFGVAVDFCLDDDPNKNGLQPNYNDEEYELLASEAKKLGLDAGYYWKFQDTPHIQLPIKQKGITWAKLNQIYQINEMVGVYEYLDTFDW
jgi:peptidoglycan L-alanyl-D-glutamate endopeptidase CwlK